MRRSVDESVAARKRSEKKRAEEEGPNADDGKWHCDICGDAQTDPRPEAAVGQHYCGKCHRQWEAGWSLARGQLSETFGTLREADGKVIGLCRKCGLPLGELTYDDEGGQATLHVECMAQLKLLEVRGKEQEREHDVAEKKRRAREEHGIGWSISMVPCSWGLAEKLGCRLSGHQSLCCLVLEGLRSVRVVETNEPAASVNLKYLALALQVRLHEGREPLFSLDPVDKPNDLESSTQVKRFDPEWLMGTAAGETMFQADYHLKELSMGEYEQPVVGMRSMTDYSEEERAGPGWNAREWFMVRKAEVCKSTDHVLIPRVEMTVEAREQIEGPDGWQDAKVTRSGHPLVKYAEEFTHNFDLIAERRSVIYHLRELAKASVLAKFLLDTQVTLDEAWFNTVDWQAVKAAASKCPLEIPQLWNDRFNSKVSLHSGACLGKPDGVFTTVHSVYGGVQFGLDRFRVAAARPVAAQLRAATTRAPVPVAAGLMAQTLVGPKSDRHPGPRGVDLSLDRFSLDEAVDAEIQAAAYPVAGKEFWPCLDSSQEGCVKHAEVLKDIFDPFLSDRRGEGDLFVAPDTSAAYMEKLRRLVEEEAKVRHQRKERFFGKEFTAGEPGPLFPASWAARLKVGSGDRGLERSFHPYSGNDVGLKDLKSMEVYFDQSTEDGMRFRIYRSGGLEVRTVQPHGGEEAVGAAFSAGAGEVAAKESRAKDSEIVRLIMQYVSAPVSGPTGVQGLRYWLLLQTEEDNVIVTEKLPSGAVAWLEDCIDLSGYAPNSRAVGSLSCSKAGLTVRDLKQHRAAHLSEAAASPADCKRYAEDAYSRAWAFSSPHWKPSPGEISEARQDEGKIVDPGAVKSGRMAALRRAAARAHADPRAVRAAVSSDGMGLERAVEQLRADREVVAAAVRENGAALKFASEHLRADRFIVRSAVEQDATSIEHAATALEADEEIARLAVDGNSYAIELLAERLRTSPGIILASLQRNEFALEHAPEALLADRAFSLAAVRRNGRALERVPQCWRGDRGFVLEVVRRNGFALKYAPDALRADSEVVLASLEQDRRAVEYANLPGLNLTPGDDVVEALRERLGLDQSDDDGAAHP